MKNQIKINGVIIDRSKLMTQQALLEHLEFSGGSDRALADVRGKYYEVFGNELIWCYPISDGYHAGVTIVVVREGFLCLPYHEITKEDYELFELDKAVLHDKDSLEVFIDDWKSFSDDLLGALSDMLVITKGDVT